MERGKLKVVAAGAAVAGMVAGGLLLESGNGKTFGASVPTSAEINTSCNLTPFTNAQQLPETGAFLTSPIGQSIHGNNQAYYFNGTKTATALANVKQKTMEAVAPNTLAIAAIETIYTVEQGITPDAEINAIHTKWIQLNSNRSERKDACVNVLDWIYHRGQLHPYHTPYTKVGSIRPVYQGNDLVDVGETPESNTQQVELFSISPSVPEGNQNYGTQLNEFNETGLLPDGDFIQTIFTNNKVEADVNGVPAQPQTTNRKVQAGMKQHKAINSSSANSKTNASSSSSAIKQHKAINSSSAQQASSSAEQASSSISSSAGGGMKIARNKTESESGSAAGHAYGGNGESRSKGETGVTPGQHHSPSGSGQGGGSGHGGGSGPTTTEAPVPVPTTVTMTTVPVTEAPTTTEAPVPVPTTVTMTTVPVTEAPTTTQAPTTTVPPTAPKATVPACDPNITKCPVDAQLGASNESLNGEGIALATVLTISGVALVTGVRRRKGVK